MGHICASLAAPPPIPILPPFLVHGGFWVPPPPRLGCGSWAVVHGMGFGFSGGAEKGRMLSFGPMCCNWVLGGCPALDCLSAWTAGKI